jgi:hypothetical protein
MDKKYQVFISSTYTDLIEERKKVQNTILSMMQFPVGMELFSAADTKQWDVIKSTIDTSDYYVLIIGDKYGTVIETGTDKGISYTEKEYRYAEEKEIPILAFIISDDAPRIKSQREDNPDKMERLKSFVTDVTAKRMVEWWSSADDLALKVSTALHKQFAQGKQHGWVRMDSIEPDLQVTDNLRKEIAELKKVNSSLKISCQAAELEAVRADSDRRKIIGFFSALDLNELAYICDNPKKIQPSKRHVYETALYYGYCDHEGKITKELTCLMELYKSELLNSHVRNSGNANIKLKI